MPDVTVRIVAEDQLTPTINKVKGEMAGLQGEATSGKGLAAVGKEAKEAGIWMEQLKELSAGIGYQVGLWNVGFMLAAKATELLGNAMSVLIPNLESYRQWMNTVGSSNAQAASSFAELKAVALDTWTSIGETQKRAITFMEQGFTPEQAVQATGMIQAQIRETGVDLGEAYQKARVYGAGIGDALKVGYAHQRDRPEIQAQALDDLRFQNTLKYIEFETHLRQQEMQRRFEDENRIAEGNRIAITQQMEDRHLAIERDLEDTEHAIQHETELRHTAIQREMEDRHRVAQEAEADTERTLGRRTAAATSMRGALESMITGLPMEGQIPFGVSGKMTKVLMAVPPGAQAVLGPQIEAGFTQLQKDLGIGREEATFMIRAGIMPAGTLLQEAAGARQERVIQNQRARAAEERTTNRQLHDESVQQSEDLYQKRRDITHELADENRTTNRRFEQDERDRAYRGQEMQRDFQDEADMRKQGELHRDLRRNDLLWDQYQKDLEDFAKQPKPSEIIMGLGAGAGGGEAGFGATVPIVGPLPKPAVPEIPAREPFSLKNLSPGGFLQTKDDLVAGKIDELIKIFQ